jgi:hypothetical protein
MTSKKTKMCGAAVAGLLLGRAGASVAQGWIDELPSVEAVRAATKGKSADDTVVRQAAAFVCWQDAVEVFTGKDAVDLARSPNTPGASFDASYRNASQVHPGHAMVDVWAYSEQIDFRKEVLAKFLSPASQEAYWKVRMATLAARAARRQSALNSRNAMTSLLDQLPSVAQVKHDLAGNGERDSVARAWAAFQILAVVAEPLYNGRAKAEEYSQAASSGKHSDRCKDDPGCVGAPNEQSPFYFCRNYYWTSPAFIRALLDKYVPPAQQSTIRNTARSAVWDEAMSMPAGSVKDFPAPIRACTAERYSIADEEARVKAIAARKRAEAIQQKLKDRIAAIQERKEAKAAADAGAKRRALADAARAADKHVDTEVFHLALGVPAPAPECDAVGHWESDADADGKAAVHLDDLHMVSSKTCLMLNEDGTTRVHWGDDVLPGWAELVETDFRADVLVAVSVTIPARPRPPNETIGIGVMAGLIASLSNGAAEAQYERMLKEGPANVAKAYKELSRKYKAPIQPVKTAHYGSRAVDEPEWKLAGLHVKYDAGPYEDTIVIELESVHEARVEAERKKDEKL